MIVGYDWSQYLVLDQQQEQFWSCFKRISLLIIFNIFLLIGYQYIYIWSMFLCRKHSWNWLVCTPTHSILYVMMMSGHGTPVTAVDSPHKWQVQQDFYPLIVVRYTCYYKQPSYRAWDALQLLSRQHAVVSLHVSFRPVYTTVMHIFISYPYVFRSIPTISWCTFVMSHPK